MHDLHKHFPLVPPSKDQPCCAVDREHLTEETRFCNKLPPQKCITPGTEEIAEDPRRRNLFRLWLARNYDFMDAVIEYLTKYMTKAGQGSLVHVMENFFTACLDKARDQQQDSGSALLRWFKLQSITNVKWQLETMHLLFGVPRFRCSLEFKDLWLRSAIQMAKNLQQILKEEGSQACQSGAKVYVHWQTWKLPSLLQRHPITGTPWWQEILTTVQPSVFDSSSLDARY